MSGWFDDATDKSIEAICICDGDGGKGKARSYHVNKRQCCDPGFPP